LYWLKFAYKEGLILSFWSPAVGPGAADGGEAPQNKSLPRAARSHHPLPLTRSRRASAPRAARSRRPLPPTRSRRASAPRAARSHHPLAPTRSRRASALIAITKVRSRLCAHSFSDCDSNMVYCSFYFVIDAHADSWCSAAVVGSALPPTSWSVVKSVFRSCGGEPTVLSTEFEAARCTTIVEVNHDGTAREVVCILCYRSFSTLCFLSTRSRFVSPAHDACDGTLR